MRLVSGTGERTTAGLAAVTPCGRLVEIEGRLEGAGALTRPLKGLPEGSAHVCRVLLETGRTGGPRILVLRCPGGRVGLCLL